MRNKLLNIEKHILIVILITIALVSIIPLCLSYFIMGYIGLPIKNTFSKYLKKIVASIITYSYSRYDGIDVDVVFEKDSMRIKGIDLK